MSSLMADAIENIVDSSSEAARANRRLIELMREGPDLGLRGKIPWTRDELHER
jgi:hypothetical protein